MSVLPISGNRTHANGKWVAGEQPRIGPAVVIEVADKSSLPRTGPADWNKPIWQHDLDTGLRILRLAIDSHLITSHRLLPLLIDPPRGLVVEVTDGTTDYNASCYRLSVFYDLAKIALNRLAFSQGHELKAYGAMAVA